MKVLIINTMDQISNIWLNEYDNLQHWVAGDIHTILVQSPTLENGFTGVSSSILYKGKNEEKARVIYAAQVAKWV